MSEQVNMVLLSLLRRGDALPGHQEEAAEMIDALHAEVEALRAQRDKMAQILRDLVPGCKWRIMRPRIDQALQEVDGGN